jgi:hypothetical protein
MNNWNGIDLLGQSLLYLKRGGDKIMNRYEANDKIQKIFNTNGNNPTKQDNRTYSANMAIQNRFYDEQELEDDIDTSLSMNSNIGAVLLPEDEAENRR